MRILAFTSLVVGLLLVAATLNASALMSSLDGNPALVDSVLHGRIAQLYLLPELWQQGLWGVSTPHCWTPFLSVWAFMPMAMITLIVLWAWRRRGAAHLAPAGLLCLFGAALPWAAGAVMLARIDQPSQAGRWITMMLGGVFWGAMVCAMFALLDLGRERLRRRPAVQPAAMVQG